MTEPMSKERLRFLADYYNVDRMPTTTAAELIAEIRRMRIKLYELAVRLLTRWLPSLSDEDCDKLYNYIQKARGAPHD